MLFFKRLYALFLYNLRVLLLFELYRVENSIQKVTNIEKNVLILEELTEK